eukprot:7274584-Prymnesium_polylepis.1
MRHTSQATFLSLCRRALFSAAATVKEELANAAKGVRGAIPSLAAMPMAAGGAGAGDAAMASMVERRSSVRSACVTDSCVL